MMQEMCDESKEDMYTLGSDQLGRYSGIATPGPGPGYHPLASN